MSQVQTAKKNPRLAMEIALVLCCKLAVIFALWFFFFGPDKRIEQTAEATAAKLLGTPVVQETTQHQSNQ